MKKWKKLSKRGLALLLSFVMCLSMLNLTVLAAGESGQSVVTKVADYETKEDYRNYFNKDGYGETAGPGYVWTDKSVEANSESNSFDVTYSALGSADVITATDLVLVLDISGSMGDPLGEYDKNDSVQIGDKGLHHFLLRHIF